MITFLNAAVVAAMISTNGVVVAVDSNQGPSAVGTTVSQVGDRCVVALVGQPKLSIFIPGAFLFHYDVPKLISELTEQLPPNPPPSSVALSLHQRLEPPMRVFKPTGVPVDDLFFLVAGIESDGSPGIWAVRVVFNGGKTPAQISKMKLPAEVGMPFPAGYGFRRSDVQVEASWKTHAPKQLLSRKPPYDLATLGDIAARMIADEKASNPAVVLPVKEIVIRKGLAPVIHTLETPK